MTQDFSFGEVLDAAYHLSQEEKRELIAVLQRRMAESARKQLIADVQESRQQFAEGRCSTATPEVLMHEIMDR